MIKIFSIFIIISIISFKVSAQDERLNQRDSALPMEKQYKGTVNQPGISKQQQRQIDIYKAKEAAIKSNSKLTQRQKKAKLAQLKKEKHKRLQAMLTPEQKERIKQIQNNKPRRGVTNLPNERTAK
ncbi:MAG TPA: hypothetical protein VGP43_09395 [Chitinophagaceae bacterium]|nr:hypothetical protein [Chitinophagaceae bacterium]